MKSQSPPKNRNGQEAVGPHDFRTGWSYWVTIPSWDVRPISKDSELDVVCSIHVDLRSPKGITKTRRMLKKLRDFTKLLTDLEKKFPNNEVLRSLQTPYLLNKEICTLEKWITKLLSDIDLSRSSEVESFLELGAVVRTFNSEDQDVNPQNSESNSRVMPTQSNLPTILGSSSIKSDYGSDTAYEKAESGTPRIRKDENSEIDVNVVGKDVHVGSTSETSLLSDGSISRLGGAEAATSTYILGNLDWCGSGGAYLGTQIGPNRRLFSSFVPQKDNEASSGVLSDVWEKVDMVKTGMKYLKERLEQESVVRIDLEAKIKKLKEKREAEGDESKDNLLHVSHIERERYNKLQWDVNELLQKFLKLEYELTSKSDEIKQLQDEKSRAELAINLIVQEKEHLLREFDSYKEQQEIVSKQYKEQKANLKADRKDLVEEVKRLRIVEQKLEEENSEAKELLQQEKQKTKQAEDANKELQHQLEQIGLLKILEGETSSPLTEVTEALRKEGLDSSNLILGIDFTKSNEHTGKYSFNNRSLHAIGNTLNPYEKAISIIGKTLAPFNEANLIPSFGFGDATTRDQEVFSFLDDDLPCHGYEQVLSRYRKLVPRLELAGPTSFAPIVDAAIQIVEESSGQYHVLVIIADGQVTRNVATSEKELSRQEEETIRSIVDSSSYPLSIILVGVGDGPWENMRKLQDKRRRFDNFQFVIYNHNACESASSPYEAFARDALMKIPDQFKAAKKLDLLGKTTGKARKVLPRPPPVPNSHPLSSGTLASLLANDKDSEPHKTLCPVCWTREKDTAFGCGHVLSMEMEKMEKYLTESEVSGQFSVPVAWLTRLPEFREGHKVVAVLAVDGNGVNWTFYCCIRRTGPYKKPYFQSQEWLKFVRKKWLRVGDKIVIMREGYSFQGEGYSFQGLRYRIRATRRIEDLWVDV